MQQCRFNLFAPLSGDHELAVRLLNPRVPEGVAEVSAVLFEYGPAPRHEYLDDRTAFDAFVEYLDSDGDRRFLGIETKLTEPFSLTTYGRDHRRAYDALTSAVDSPWRRDAGDAVSDVRWNQVWRNQLLVEATRKHPEHAHGDRGRLVIVHHQDDLRCQEVVDGYRKLLEGDPDDSLLVWPLDQLVGQWEPRASGPSA